MVKHCFHRPTVPKIFLAVPYHGCLHRRTVPQNIHRCTVPRTLSPLFRTASFFTAVPYREPFPTLYRTMIILNAVPYYDRFLRCIVPRFFPPLYCAANLFTAVVPYREHFHRCTARRTLSALYRVYRTANIFTGVSHRRLRPPVRTFVPSFPFPIAHSPSPAPLFFSCLFPYSSRLA